MSITLNLGADLEARLRTEAERQGKPVESLLQNWIEEKTGEQETGTVVSSATRAGGSARFYQTATPEEWVKEFLRWTGSFPTPEHPLPDEALSRESIYEDRW